MSSQPSFTLLRFSSTFSGSTALLSPAKRLSKPFLDVSSVSALSQEQIVIFSKDEQVNIRCNLQCKAVSKPRIEEHTDVFQNGLPVIKWNEIVDDDTEGEVDLEVPKSNKIKEHVESIRSMLSSMDDGEISISAYDTAWVALVEDIHGSGAPQFPSSLQWIAKNQLPDGSWGDKSIFEAHDRIINTLACIIALKTWNIHPDQCKKGISFIKKNICKLEDENAEHMPIGFEVAFPSLIEIAQKLDIEVPYDSPVLQEIYAKRNLKLTRIPRDIMHLVPTTLLHSLEGMTGLEWEKLLKLQCQDGSFLFSPSSTAFALMQTKDDNCLRYLSRAVERFNGGVPNVYPVDLFEHIWAVDRLERLGIARYFQSEIKECVDYVYRYWTEEGICWARNSPVHDIDDTAMAFRLLRLHGHHVSADVFGHFKKGGEFFCFAGQSNQAVTGMFNLYRASQVLFPGEKILEDAKKFSAKFLREKQAINELLDKWIITKDLPGEVGYALDMPWYASLSRVETRFYLEQYGGEDDVWIGKTLYRWYTECNLGEFGMNQRNLLLAYYLAAASIYEPERSKERAAWAKTATLVETIVSYFEEEGSSVEQRRAFLNEFINSGGHHQLDYVNNGSCSNNKVTREGKGQKLIRTLHETLNQLSLDAVVAHGRDIRHHLHHIWEMWMMTWQEEGKRYKEEAVLLVRMINLCAGRWAPEELLLLSQYPQYKRLSDLTNNVCHQIRMFQQRQHRNKGGDEKNDKSKTNSEKIEAAMQALVQMVVCHDTSDGIDPDVKQTFLTVAKTYYYTLHRNAGAIYFHIAKVLFERVV
ncbi:hypothetical protein ACSBR2_031980 [Camellia fascicularis]